MASITNVTISHRQSPLTTNQRHFKLPLHMLDDLYFEMGAKYLQSRIVHACFRKIGIIDFMGANHNVHMVCLVIDNCRQGRLSPLISTSFSNADIENLLKSCIRNKKSSCTHACYAILLVRSVLLHCMSLIKHHLEDAEQHIPRTCNTSYDLCKKIKIKNNHAVWCLLLPWCVTNLPRSHAA